MNRQKIILDPVFPKPEETEVIKLLDRLLEKEIENADSEESKVQFVEVGGKAIALPESLYQLLRQAVHLMAADRAVSLAPIELALTVEEAAILLNVPQQFMMKLLSEGEIKYAIVGSEPRIGLADLMAYKKQRTIKRRDILRELAQFSQEEELNENRVYS